MFFKIHFKFPDVDHEDWWCVLEADSAERAREVGMLAWEGRSPFLIMLGGPDGDYFGPNHPTPFKHGEVTEITEEEFISKMEFYTECNKGKPWPRQTVTPK